MKKLAFTIVAGALILGAGAGYGTHFAISYHANAVMVKAEELESSSQEVELTEEEKTKLQALIAELKTKYEEIKNFQVAGTTVGAIAGALVGAIVSAVPALMNRSNIKKAIENVALCKENVRAVEAVGKEVKEEFKIANEKYDKAIKVIESLGKELSNLETKLNGIENDNASLKQDNAELKELIIVMINNNPTCVANGVAELINQKFGK